MAHPVLRIFSYLPNPRVYKAQIAADICGVEIEVVGAKPGELPGWLWDFDARPLAENERSADSPHARQGKRGFGGTLFKTDAFLAAHPFGTVPAAFSPDGKVGIFESNSILRAVARATDGHGLYGQTGYEASRIDSFLDANLVFAREAQVYLLGMDAPRKHVHERMAGAYEFYLAGIEAALTQTAYIAAEELTLADISFVCDFAQFLREGHYQVQLNEAGLAPLAARGADTYPRAFKHLMQLADEAPFRNRLGSYLDWYRRALAEQAR